MRNLLKKLEDGKDKTYTQTKLYLKIFISITKQNYVDYKSNGDTSKKELFMHSFEENLK